MSFTSLIFLFYFFPIALFTYYITPKKHKNKTLLLLSLLFYSWGEPVYFVLLILSIIATYYITPIMYSKKESREEKKFYLVLLVMINIMALLFFKYYGFIINNINGLFGSNLKITTLPLPFGISFYTFKVLSYIFDVYYEKCKPQKSFTKLALYISMFPQIGAGPIIRYSQMEEELTSRKITPRKIGIGVEKFILGFAKKVLIANNLALIWSQVKGLEGLEMSTLTAWLGIIAYSLQIYFDFSGYSDMAIGIGYMFGFEWPENFNYPYISKSISEFWRRWHISLGSWFREYIYIPLGGNRVNRLKQIRNIFVVWMLTGFWHGPNWNFAFWGLYFGVIIFIEKMFTGKWLQKRPGIIQNMYAMLIVLFSWVMFDVAGVSNIFHYYSNMLIFGANGIVDSFSLYILKTNWIILLIALIGIGPGFLNLVKNIRIRCGVKGCIIVGAFYVLIFVLSTASLVGESYSPFLYFQF